MNSAAYIIYLFITTLVTVRTGWLFYRNGKIYILQLLPDEEPLADFINRMLLTGYYLLNLGYAAVMIRFWKTIHTLPQLVADIGYMTGRILLTLAIIHFCNMAALYFFSIRHHSHLSKHTT